MSYFIPTRIAPSRATTDKPASAPVSDALDEKTALEALSELFKFNATSRVIENGPYAGMSPSTKRCATVAGIHTCKIALKATETRCTFHSAAGKFTATGFGAEDIYEGSPAQAQIAQRLEALKL